MAHAKASLKRAPTKSQIIIHQYSSLFVVGGSWRMTGLGGVGEDWGNVRFLGLLRNSLNPRVLAPVLGVRGRGFRGLRGFRDGGTCALRAAWRALRCFMPRSMERSMAVS